MSRQSEAGIDEGGQLIVVPNGTAGKNASENHLQVQVQKQEHSGLQIHMHFICALPDTQFGLPGESFGQFIILYLRRCLHLFFLSFSTDRHSIAAWCQGGLMLYSKATLAEGKGRRTGSNYKSSNLSKPLFH